MTVGMALILSIIEGITEFLPVSSTGHLILAGMLLGIPSTYAVKSFELFIQLGAISAVVVLYARTILSNIRLWKVLAIAFLPTGIIGLTLYKLIKSVLLGNPLITVAALGIGGVLLIVFEKWHPAAKKSDPPPMDLATMRPVQAILIGLGQSVAMIPGVSRSAATIITGMLTGLSRTQAVEFSFLLAIPTMAFATGYDLLKTADQLSFQDMPVFAVGFVGAFITALITIRWFLHYIAHHTFVLFGIYRIAVAIAYVLLVR